MSCLDFVIAERVENHYERWNMGKENFLYEIKARSIPIDHCSSSFIDDLYEYSNKLARFYSLPSYHYQRFRKEFLSCLTVDIGCLILNQCFSICLLDFDKEHLNEVKDNFHFGYFSTVTALIFENQHLLTDSQKQHFGNSIECMNNLYYHRQVTVFS